MSKPLFLLLFFLLLSSSGSCPFSAHESRGDGDHHHHHLHHHHEEGGCDGHHHEHHHHHHPPPSCRRSLLPEEVAEEEDLWMEEAGAADRLEHHHRHNVEMSTLGLWIRAMGCSLLVSMASLICLIILPVILLQGKPSKTVVDSLAAFGAGAMLGDAFLHQLPHAFGGGHTHSHDHHDSHDHEHGHAHSHSHSIADLSVGLSVLSGIILFLLVEKVVRYVEDHSKGANQWGHHHHHKVHHKLETDDLGSESNESKDGDAPGTTSESNSLNGLSEDCIKDEKQANQETHLRKRNIATSSSAGDGEVDTADDHVSEKVPLIQTSQSLSPSSLVFGYLNLFSDGVHNFTDGMALGSAFLLHGSVGGWSRTLFLLAHELPQEVGDFGILVRSGFSVSKALFFNFLSALMALAGTALVNTYIQQSL
ncbi:IAA-alanine resistance protein 1 [Acorus gramineus]|uniref:IAA-alanine resistance protein 1 n=1 Tax=Acorus gramineus TaxID=55184 RepID=A0AAV8ZY13_ACOGR|nr:IAA-alanine resistance protein 1 [Acorus gramineus]